MTNASETVVHPINAHSIKLEEPDVFVFRHVGDLGLEEVNAFLGHLQKFCEGKARVYGIIDQREGGNLASDARRALVGKMPKQICGVVFMGVSLVGRVGISLGHKAYVMMNRGQDHPHTFATDDAEAYAWIANQRKIDSTKS